MKTRTDESTHVLEKVRYLNVTSQFYRAYCFIIFGLVMAIGVGTALPCTTFVLTNGPHVYFGRNLDWWWPNALIILNQRDVRKASLVPPGTTAAHWVSKYGSLTFNQFGQEMPYGGINEAGLVVECMWLDDTKYAPADSRPAVNLLQWIQYQLDNCRTVDEVLASDKDLRVYAPNGSARIHYLVADASGDCAAVEILDGCMVTHKGPNFPFRALANQTYESSVQALRGDPEGGNSNPRSSNWRFSRAAVRAANFKAGESDENVGYAFDTLSQLSQGDFTVWNIVYDVTRRRVHFRTRGNSEIRVVDLQTMNFSCGNPVKYMSIDAKPDSTKTSEWSDLSETRQREYLENFVSNPAVQQKLGDLTPQTQGQLLLLRGLRCKD